MLKKVEKIQNALISYRDAKKEEQWDSALKTLNSAIEIDKNNLALQASLHFKRANVFNKLNKKENALADLNKTIELNPYEDYLNYYFYRGCLLFDMKRYEEGQADIIKGGNQNNINLITLTFTN